MVDLIQNRILNNPSGGSQTAFCVAQRGKCPDFDIEHELRTRRLMKPTRGKGKLVESSVSNIPSDIYYNTKYMTKSLRRALKGRANDHELGKINDFGMYLGGLGIASFLATKRTTPLTKGMEFVGPAVFFATMALWPKVAIHLPTKLIHGVNTGQQYQDSFNRRKPFYQDPQFLPWDLYTDEQINKIGDRLGVPKDIPNRRDFTQEKMKKIAVQNNTLWMLSAGFATPVMTALICNKIEPYLLKLTDKMQRDKADKLLKNLDSEAQKVRGDSLVKNVEKLIANSEGGLVQLKKIIGTFTSDVDPIIARDLTTDLQTMFNSNEFVMNRQTAKQISANIKNALGEEYAAVLPDEKSIQKLFEEHLSFQADTIRETIYSDIDSRVAAYNKANPEKAINHSVSQKIRQIAGKDSGSIIDDALLEFRSVRLDASKKETLTKLASTLTDLNAKSVVLNKYTLMKTGNIQESAQANFWNQMAPDLIKGLKIKGKDIEYFTDETLRIKLNKLVSDDEAYTKLFNKIVKQIKLLDEKLGNTKEYTDLVNKVYDDAGIIIRELGFTNAARSIFGIDEKYAPGNLNGFPEKVNNPLGSAKFAMTELPKEKVDSVRNILYRWLNTLDLFKRQTGLPEDEIVKLSRQFMLTGEPSDHAVKLHIRKPEQYKAVMRMMYGEDIAPLSRELLGKEGLEGLRKNRSDIITFIGNQEYFVRPEHNLGPKDIMPDSKIYFLNGLAPNEFAKKEVNKLRNSKKWFKIFARAGAIIFAATVVAQFFFGQMKKPQKAVSDDK